MGPEAVHLSIGVGLNIVVGEDIASAATPLAMIHIQGGAVPFSDEACALSVRLSPDRLMTILGNGPLAETVLGRAGIGGIHIPVRNPGVVRRIADDIRHASYEGDSLAVYLQGKVIELLVEGLAVQKLCTSERIALSVRDILLANPQHPPPVAELARINGVSPRKLAKSFHAHFGKSIPSWLSEWRLNRARDLLLGSDLSVRDVAISVGYTQVTAFTRIFTNHFGTPPSRIRARTAAAGIPTVGTSPCTPSSRKGKRKRIDLGLMALEPRWMFDGAAVVDAAHAAPDASAKALIPDAPAAVQVRAADPSQDGGKKEVVFVDTSLANYQALEAAVKPGIEIEEIGGGQSGLAQMAKWAETHTGYDSISVVSPGAEATLNIGTDALTDADLSTPVRQAELAAVGSALKAGGDLMLYGSDVAAGSDGQTFIADIAAATGAKVAASDSPIGLAGNWTLDQRTGATDATAFAAPDYAGDLYIAPTEIRAADPALNGGKLEVVFVDTTVVGYRTLEADVGPGIEVVEINGGRSGLEQMTVWAATHSGYDSISVLSHGGEAQFFLGTDSVTGASLSRPVVQAELASIGAALKPGGDFLLYGCDVAAGSDGLQFIKDLATDTGAVVEASSHQIGADGGWTLDVGTGAGTATRFVAADFSGDLNVPVATDGGTISVASGPVYIQTTSGLNFGVSTLSAPNLPAGYFIFAGSDLANAQSHGPYTDGSQFSISASHLWLEVTSAAQNGTFITVSFTLVLGTNGQTADVSFNIAALTGGYTPTLTAPTVTVTRATSYAAAATISGGSSATDAGATMTVYDNGSQIGTATADGSGNWSIGSVTLPQGSNSITVTATKTYYNSATSGATSATVDSGPIFTNNSSVTINSSSPFALTAHATDTASPSITYSIVSGASHGTASINSSTGVMSYSLSPSSYVGNDSFVIKATDGYGVFTSQTIHVLSDNPPTVTVTNPAPTYIVGQSAQVVDSGITISDADSPASGAGLAGGSLSASLSGGDSANDVLAVGAMTLANGHVIAVSGSTVTDNGVTVGTVSGGANGSALTIALASGDTSAQVTDIARAITFSGGNTTNSAQRTITFTVTDAVNVSATGNDTARAILGPTIYSAVYDPATGNLTLTGGDFTTSAADYTLSGLVLSGEGSSTYALGNGDAITGTPSTTSLVINIASANRAAVDALFDKCGTTAVGGNAFNINTATDWDHSGSTHAPAATTNAVTVTSSGTPTLTDNGPVPPADPATNSVLVTVDSGTVTVTDSPDFSGNGIWNNGNLTVAFGATNHDSSHDQLTIATTGGITTSGSGAGEIISYNGTQIGTVQSGATGTPGQNLTVALNGSATDAAIAALVKAIQFNDTATATGGDRTINFTVTDAYGKSSAALATAVHVYTPPVISSVAYDPNTGLLTLTGTNFTVGNTDFTLSKLSITGEGSSTYTLNSNDSVSSVTTTKVIIQIDPGNQPAVDALLDKTGTTAASNGNPFYLSAAAGWDATNVITEPVSNNNAITVTSTGTPTLTHSSAITAYDVITGSVSVAVDAATITVTDQPDLSGAGQWNGGNLTMTLGGTNYDSSHDQLTIASTGTNVGISTSGSTANSTVSYNGHVIGTIKSGSTGTPNTPLEIVFNSAYATDAAIAALVNAIQFSDSAGTTTGIRTVTFIVTDAYGRASSALSDTISVVPPPVITSAGVVVSGGAGWTNLSAGLATANNGGPAVSNNGIAIAAGPNGTLFITENNGGGPGVYTYNGSTWTYTGLAGGIGSPTIAVAPSGSPNAGTAYISTTYNGYNISLLKDTNGVVTAAGLGYGVNGQVAVSYDGTVDVIFTPFSGYYGSIYNYAVVQKFNSDGTYLGQVGGNITENSPWTYPPVSIAFAPGTDTPYFTLNQASGYIVEKFDGSTWNTILTQSGVSGTNIAFSPDGTPYVAFSQGSTVTVERYVNGSWSTVGSTVNSGGALAIGTNSSGTVFFASSNGAYEYNSSTSSWDALGAPNFGGYGLTSFVVTPTGNLFAAYGDNSYSNIKAATYSFPGVFYDPYTGNLTITGTNFTTSANDYTLSDLSITGESGAGTYTLGGDDAISGTPTSTSLTIHIGADHQQALDAILDAAGTTSSVNSSQFNLVAAQGWDRSGGIIAPASSIDSVSVTSTGTPTLTNSSPVAPVDTSIGSTAKVIDSSTITVTDQPDFSGAGVWAGGNLTVTIGATNKDSSHDELLVGTVGPITTSGSGAGEIIYYNGTQIGTVDSTNTGLPGHSLTIKFSGAAVSDAAVQALVNAIQFMDTASTNTGDRTVTFTVTDAYNRASSALSDTVHVVSGPTISGVTYDPFTGTLTLVGGALVGSTGSITLGDLTLSGEGSGSYTLGNGDSVTSVSSTQVVINIASANRATVDALLDKNGTTAAVNTSHTFNLNAAYSWDASGGVIGQAAPTNTVTVTSSGTPTLTGTAHATPTDTNVQSTAVTVDASTITAGDTAYFSGTGIWNNGNLTVAVSGANADSGHDQLSIGAVGLITTSGSTAGSTVSYNGTQIGTIASGSTGAPGQALRINLSGANATNAAVQALVNAIQFSDSGTTASIGSRTVTFTLADAYARSASLADTVTVVGVPAISGVAYNPATGILTLSGTNFTTTAADYTLSGLVLSGEGSGTYAIGNGDAISGTPSATSVTIQIASANQAAVDALLDKNGTTAAVSTTHSFNLAAAAGWDANGSVSAFVAATNTVTVASTGTPTLTNNSPTIASDTTTGSIPKVIDSSTITVTDAPNLSGAGMWSGGNLTVALGATNRDSAHDKLSVGAVGGITTSGSGAGQIISYNGSVIGTVQTGAAGTLGQSLTIKFSGSAVTDAAVAALANAIQFSDTATTTPGTRSLTFTATDAYGRSTSALAEKIYVTQDTPPVFVNGSATQSITIAKNATVTVSSATLSVADLDANQTETWSASVGPSHGALTFSRYNAASGSSSIAGPVVVYTPTTDYIGSDSFTIQVSDGQGGIVTKTYNVTVITPVVNSITRTGAAAVTNSSSDSFTVTFNEAVSGLTAANFSLGGTDGTGTIGTPTTSNGGVTWTVPVTGVSGNGTLGLNLVNNLTSVQDGFSQTLAAGFTDTASLYTIDTIAPVITGVTFNAATYAVGSLVTATIATDYDGNGNYTLSSASTIDGAALTVTGSSFNSTTGTITATFTVTSALTDVLSGSVPVNLVVTDMATNTSATYTTGAAAAVIDSHVPTAIALSNNVTPLIADGVVGTLSATDASTGAETFTYAITGGASASKFQIVGNTLEVADATTLTHGTSYSVNVQVSDAGGNTRTQTFTLTGANGPGASAGGTLTYSERAAAAVIDTSVTLVDATGSGTMSGARVAVSSGFTSGDVLGFTNQNGITGSYNAGTGVLTLSGTASFADYQTALRSVTFAAPTLYETATTPRTITWSGTDAVGTGTAPTSTVSVVYVNAPPTLTLTSEANASIGTAAGASGGTTLFTGANSSAIEAGQSITGITLSVAGLADGASEQIQIGGSWVSLTSGASGTAGGIAYTVGTISAGATTLTLSKTDTAANWNTAINALAYRDTAAGSSTAGARTITITSISDSGGTANGGANATTVSDPATITLNTNDMPVVTVASAQTFSDTTSHAITGVSVADGASGASVTATVTAQHGNLTFTGAGISNNGSATVTITAANTTALNTILGTLHYATSYTTPPATRRRAVTPLPSRSTTTAPA